LSQKKEAKIKSKIEIKPLHDTLPYNWIISRQFAVLGPFENSILETQFKASKLHLNNSNKRQKAATYLSLKVFLLVF